MELILATNNEINALHLKFNKFDVHLLEEPRKLYNFIGTMDVFNRVLNAEEASELLVRSHNIKHSTKFVSTWIYVKILDTKRLSFFLHNHHSWSVPHPK